MSVAMNILIRHAEEVPNSLVARSDLRGRFIARDLSRLLVLILLVLSPLTFSNDNIPNFQPDGVSSYSLSTKNNSTVAVMQPDKPTKITAAEATVNTPHSPNSDPHISPLLSSQPSRAPPV
jgi:hypothetical protein